MLTRWKIQESPTKSDPLRRILMLQAAMDDVQRLVRILGAQCGRPKRLKDGNFNFTVILHGMDRAGIEQLRSELAALCPPPVPPSAPSAGLLGKPVAAKPEPPAPPRPEVVPPKEVPTPKAEPAAASDAPSESPRIDLAALMGVPASEPAPEPASPPAPEPALPPAPEPQEAPLPPAAREPEPPKAADAAFPPPVSTFQGSAAAPFREQTQPSLAPSGAPIGGQTLARRDSPPTPEWTPALEKLSASPLCGASSALIQGKTFESLSVGLYNRFAHAAAMSVVTNPGAMYNPLFISGNAGTGKSHLLHAIGQRLQEQSPDEAVLLTSGPRLALAANLACRACKLRELEGAASRSKALLVDDIHLLGINEQNQPALAGLFSSFFKASKQVVITSAYPAKLLGALEDSLGFKIATGHSAELKSPDESAQREIMSQLLALTGFEYDGLAEKSFLEAIGKDFSAANSGMRRLHAAKALLEPLGKPFALKDLLALVFAADAGGPESVSREELAKALPAQPPLENPTGAAVALFYPKGEQTHADWTWHRLRQEAEGRGWPFPFRLALRRAYDAEQVFGVPFLIADECQKAGSESALVVGPVPGTELFEKEAEFRYALDHLLAPCSCRLGWVPHERVKSPMTYVLAYLDVMP